MFSSLCGTRGGQKAQGQHNPMNINTCGWVLLPNHPSFWSHWGTSVTNNATKSWANQNQTQTSKDILVQPSLRSQTAELHPPPCGGGGHSREEQLRKAPARAGKTMIWPSRHKALQTICCFIQPSFKQYFKNKNNPASKFLWDQREPGHSSATRPRCLPGAGARCPAPGRAQSRTTNTCKTLNSPSPDTCSAQAWKAPPLLSFWLQRTPRYNLPDQGRL